MKFFHLSDLHIGLKLLGRDLMEDQAYILGRIADAARREQPDAIVIAGDIYDKAVPSAEAVSAFDGFIAALSAAAPKAELMLISGNHDSAARLNLYRGLLNRQRVHMIGLPPQAPGEHIEVVTLYDSHGPVDFYLLPFVKPSMVKAIVGVDEDGNNLSYDESLRRLIAREAIDPARRSVLVSHQFYVPVGTDAAEIERTEGEIVTVGNIDAVRADVLEPFDYAALGHIHRPMKVGGERRFYCGSPLAASVSEAGQQKAIALVELGEKGDVRVSTLPLAPLRQVKVVSGTLDEVLRQGCGDYVTVLLSEAPAMDSFDLRDRLQAAFPGLLEIRRALPSAPAQDARLAPQALLDPLALCDAFLGEVDDDTHALLADAVNTVLEAKRP